MSAEASDLQGPLLAIVEIVTQRTTVCLNEDPQDVETMKHDETRAVTG
jgi:hypothetical protein